MTYKPPAPRMPDAPIEPDRCAAHGCPLRATIFDTVVGQRQHGRCRYHDALAPRFWPQLTEALNANPSDLKAAVESVGLVLKEPKPSFKREHVTRSGHRVTGPVSFAQWFSHFKANAPTVCPPIVGTFIHAGAMPHVPSALDFEAREERAAIQAEGNPL